MFKTNVISNISLALMSLFQWQPFKLPVSHKLPRSHSFIQLLPLISCRGAADVITFHHKRGGNWLWDSASSLMEGGGGREEGKKKVTSQRFANESKDKFHGAFPLRTALWGGWGVVVRRKAADLAAVQTNRLVQPACQWFIAVLASWLAPGAPREASHRTAGGGGLGGGGGTGESRR